MVIDYTIVGYAYYIVKVSVQYQCRNSIPGAQNTEVFDANLSSLQVVKYKTYLP